MMNETNNQNQLPQELPIPVQEQSNTKRNILAAGLATGALLLGGSAVANQEPEHREGNVIVQHDQEPEPSVVEAEVKDIDPSRFVLKEKETQAPEGAKGGEVAPAPVAEAPTETYVIPVNEPKEQEAKEPEHPPVLDENLNPITEPEHPPMLDENLNPIPEEQPAQEPMPEAPQESAPASPESQQ